MNSYLLRFIAFLLVIVMLLPISVFASENESVEVFAETSADSFVLMDGFTGSVIASKNADLSLPMASTTKIMTCLVALENGRLSDLIEIPKEAVGVEGSSVYLTQGEKLSLEELLFALMLESANDAAVAIALHISQDISSFAALMNQKARELKMSSTNFVNPHGLPTDGHFSSARDLCKLLAYSIQNDAFRVFSGTKTMTISGPNGTKRYLANHNKLLRLYADCIGGKTGYTKEAGRCLVTAAEKNGRILICATLGDPNDWMDHVSLYQYGFSLFLQKEVVGAGQLEISVPVVGGTKSEIMLTNSESYSPWVRADEVISCIIEAPHFTYAGVFKDQVIGYAVYSINGIEAKRIELIANETVSKRKDKLSFWEKIIQKIKLWMD